MEPEIIVSVLASDALLARVRHEGAVAVLADIDPQTGGLNREQVEAVISIGTRRVIVEEEYGFLAPWVQIERSTEPRGIVLEAPIPAHLAKWSPIAPGMRGWGEHLVEIDERLLVDGVIEELNSEGVEATPYETPMAFERMGSGLRGRRRDYPGAVAWQRKIIVVPEWQESRSVLMRAARTMARQMSLAFEAADPASPIKPVQKQTDSNLVALSA